MKKLIFLFLAIAGLSSAPKLIAGTLYADQLALYRRGGSGDTLSKSYEDCSYPRTSQVTVLASGDRIKVSVACESASFVRAVF